MTQEFDPIAYINQPRWTESRYGLERIEELLERLGNPHQHMSIVHVAGTNGKGSTCAFVDSILRTAGFHVGLFTSPYVIEFAERIRIDGANITLDELRACTLLVRAQAEAMDDHPTEFELMTAVAFVAFQRARVDFAVVEVGLGGRLDSTNAIRAPEVCALAPIALDHTELLGDTVAQIAAEKAGIIKPGATVVSAVQAADAEEAIRSAARACECDVRCVDGAALRTEGSGALVSRCSADDETPFGIQRFSYRDYEELESQLLGSYQPENAGLAIEVALALRDRGFDISDEAIRAGIASATWPGRFQIVGDEPTFIIDGGHNAQGAQALAQSLARNFPGRKVVFLMGVLADKQYESMIETVREFAQAFVCITPPNPRALESAQLANAIKRIAPECGNDTYASTDIAEGVRQAMDLAGAEGIVCAFGSLYSLESILRSYA